ncbi:transcription factor Adf-1-like [Musca autumnalis]|uniref:transcription factor Adf-1-like n=1 Tax=Musca autumnalis TaxID=221902 RepID=UPI003CFB1D58
MFEEELINSIQLHECIYNKGSNLYRNKIAKEKAWSAVAAEVGKPVKQCQTRWKSLRDRYTKEHLKLSSGSGAPEYSPEWRFTNSMSFLSDYIQPRPTTSNFDTNEGDEYTYEYLSDDLEITFEEYSQPDFSPNLLWMELAIQQETVFATVFRMFALL